MRLNSYFPYVLLVPLVLLNSDAHAENWPQFRGEHARGISTSENSPVAWNLETGENIRWKTPISGLAHSSPVVWGDRLYVTTAVSADENAELKVGLYGDIASVKKEPPHEWKLYCLDKNTGNILWERVAHAGVPQVERHTKATHANSTPATDGEHVVAFFGSEGLYCYSAEGDLLWSKDFGKLESVFYMMPTAQWGFASSPVIHDGVLVIQCDVKEDSFLAAFDVATGKEIWRTPRNDVPTWSTPTVYPYDGKTAILVNGYRHAGGYDFNTGEEIWKLTVNGDIPIPTPVAADGLIYLNSAHGRHSPIYAVKETAKGDVTLKDDKTSNKHVKWSVPRGGSYHLTPMVYDGYLYNCRMNGRLTCFNAKNGEEIYTERLGGTGVALTASAVAADGKLYFTSEHGTVFVVKAGPEFELLEENDLDDVCMATPAITDGTIYFRTQHNLVAIGEK